MEQVQNRRAYDAAAGIFKDACSVSAERMVQHGGIVTEYTHLSRLWSIILGIEIPPELAVIMMVVHKANRIACGARNHRDHYLDGSNYFALAWGVRDTLYGPPPGQPAVKDPTDDQATSRLVPRNCGDPTCPNCAGPNP